MSADSGSFALMLKYIKLSPYQRFVIAYAVFIGALIMENEIYMILIHWKQTSEFLCGGTSDHIEFLKTI